MAIVEAPGLLSSPNAWVAVTLAWVGGCVDAIGFLMLAHLFTAHMSGNSAAMGAFLGAGRGGAGLHRAFPIPLFVLGVVLGYALLEGTRRGGGRHAFRVILGIEAILLILFWVSGQLVFQGHAPRQGVGVAFHAVAALPVLAMGLQNTALRHVGRTGIHTTYVTGVLDGFGRACVSVGFALLDALRAEPRRRKVLLRRVARHAAIAQGALLGSVWLAYALGAYVGGVIVRTGGLLALGMPITALIILIASDVARPLPAREGPHDP